MNISWIFFRAKEWDDAIKVLSAMFSLNNIILPNFLESRLQFLKSFGITFGGVMVNIDGDNFKPLWLIYVFILVLFFNNSMQEMRGFRANYLKIFYITLILPISFYLMIIVKTEFLYFNF